MMTMRMTIMIMKTISHTIINEKGYILRQHIHEKSLHIYLLVVYCINHIKMKPVERKRAMSGMTLKPELLAEVDRLRGDYPRSRFISKALTRYLDDIKNQRITVLGEAIIQKNEVQK